MAMAAWVATLSPLLKKRGIKIRSRICSQNNPPPCNVVEMDPPRQKRPSFGRRPAPCPCCEVSTGMPPTNTRMPLPASGTEVPEGSIGEGGGGGQGRDLWGRTTVELLRQENRSMNGGYISLPHQTSPVVYGLEGGAGKGGICGFGRGRSVFYYRKRNYWQSIEYEGWLIR